jgi:hypothetical protein
MSTRVWQITGGPVGRCYADVLIRHGVALLGPGDAGAWSAERDDADFDGPLVRRFATEPAIGDPVLLRTGPSKICAVGILAGSYQHIEAFDDVNGFDLQHARRVRWCELPTEYDFGEPVFGQSAPRFGGVQDERVRDYVRRFLTSPPTYWQEAALPALPTEEPLLHDVPERLAGLVAEAQDLHPLLWDRDRFGPHPSEDEMVVHFVVPLFRALGWSTECIGIKWRYVDVALFIGLPRGPETCRFVVEVKRLGAGVEGALEQARGYVDALGLPSDVMVTDGIRYRLYARAEGFAPVAYANLARLKQPATELFARLTRP